MAERLGILQVSPFFLFPDHQDLWKARFDPLGGMHLLVHSMATELATRGISQTILAMGLPGAPKDLSPKPNLRVLSCRLPVLPIPSKLEGYVGLVMAYALGSLWWIWRNRKSLRQSIGLIHVHCDGSGAVPWLGRMAGKILRAPLVMQIHSCRNLTQIPTTVGEHIADPFAKRSERDCIEAASSVITLTERLKRRLVSELDVSADKIACLAFSAHRHFTAEDTATNRSKIARECGLNSDRPVVTYLGRLAIEKGVDVFVDMAGKLTEDRDYSYLVIGDGPEMETVRSRVQSAGLQDRFHFTGFLPPEMVAPALRHAWIGVVPSRYEEFGLVIPEFMQMRVPVVACDVGGVGEVISHEINGLLVSPGDATALADGVKRLADEPELRSSIVDKAEIDARRYTMSSGFASLLHLYAGLLPGLSHIRQ